MLNHLWAGMILLGILWGSFQGTLDVVTEGILESAKEAVELSLAMLGMMSFWCGIMKLAEECGLIKSLTAAMRPVIRFLYPGIPKGHPAAESISLNMIANMLGLGGAATPAGLQAMRDLEQLEEDRRIADQKRSVPKGTASAEMCTFLIINCSSLQIIPLNMIVYRSEFGSADPMGIIGPVLLATLVSTLAGILFSKICSAICRK